MAKFDTKEDLIQWMNVYFFIGSFKELKDLAESLNIKGIFDSFYTSKDIDNFIKDKINNNNWSWKDIQNCIKQIDEKHQNDEFFLFDNDTFKPTYNWGYYADMIIKELSERNNW